MSDKSIIIKIREAIDDNLKSRNSIDRLMRDKIEDFYLIDEQPLPIKIGEKTIYVGNLTFNNWRRFIHDFSKIMANVGISIANFEILSNPEELIKHLAINKSLHKSLCRLIKNTILSQHDYYERELSNGLTTVIRLPKVSLRYFKKNITMEKLIQILFLIHRFNFDAVKKNFKILVDAANTRQLTETYIYSWLQNLPGLTGKFVEDRSINYDYWQQDQLREEYDLAGKPVNETEEVELDAQ